MNIKPIAAIVLILLGVTTLASSGFTFTTPGETIQFFGLRIETRVSQFAPPVIGAFALIGCAGLLLLKPRSL